MTVYRMLNCTRQMTVTKLSHNTCSSNKILSSFVTDWQKKDKKLLITQDFAYKTMF